MDDVTFKNAMGQFATGVVVISGNRGGELVGFAAQSFVSLSVDPPMILFCPQKSSTSWPKVRPLRQFSINVLNQSQSELSEAFAVPGEVPIVKWHVTDRENPVIDQSIATIECLFDTEYEAGDHLIVVASVTDVHVHDDAMKPLLYFRGSYDL